MNKQSFGAVFTAEFKSTALKKSMLIMLISFTVVAILLGVATDAITHFAQSLDANLAKQSIPFQGFGTSLSFLSFALGLLCAAFVARGFSDGSVASSLVVVPNRNRLMCARLLVWICVAFASMLVAYLVLALLYFNSIPNMGECLLNSVGYALGVMLLTCVAFGIAYIVQRGSLSILLFIAVDFILPVGISAAALALPNIADVLMQVEKAMPGKAMEVAVELSRIVSGGIGDWAFAAVALVVWAVAALLIGRLVFGRSRGTL